MLLAIPSGLAIGLALGMLGGGGAVLAVPVLVYVLEQDVQAATTTSLAVVIVAAISGGAGQASRGVVCWRHVLWFTPGALGGVIVGTLANRAVDGSALLIAFSLVMLAAAAFTWYHAGGNQDEDSAPCPRVPVVRTLAVGAVVGAMTGFFGVGGGFLIVPMLALALRVPVRRAIGTSIIIVGFVSLLGLATHLSAGSDIDLSLTALLALACIAGALAGSRLGAHVPQRTLGRAFAALVALVAAYVLIASAFFGGPPGAT